MKHFILIITLAILSIPTLAQSAKAQTQVTLVNQTQSNKPLSLVVFLKKDGNATGPIESNTVIWKVIGNLGNGDRLTFTVPTLDPSAPPSLWIAAGIDPSGQDAFPHDAAASTEISLSGLNRAMIVITGDTTSMDSPVQFELRNNETGDNLSRTTYSERRSSHIGRSILHGLKRVFTDPHTFEGIADQIESGLAAEGE